MRDGRADADRGAVHRPLLDGHLGRQGSRGGRRRRPGSRVHASQGWAQARARRDFIP